MEVDDKIKHLQAASIKKVRVAKGIRTTKTDGPGHKIDKRMDKIIFIDPECGNTLKVFCIISK